VSSRATSLSDIDFSDPAFLADPYMTYAQAQGDRTVWLDSGGVWATADYRQAVQVFRSHHFGPAADAPASTREPSGSLQVAGGSEHARLKGPIADAFQPAAVRLIEGVISDRLHRLLGRLPRGEVVDFMTDVAHPLSAQVIASILGMPEPDLPPLIAATMRVAAGMGLGRDPETVEAARSASEEVTAYMAGLADERRRRPQDDLVSRLVRAQGLTEAECATMIRLLFSTGSVPMAFALGNTVLALLSHPDQLAHLRARPDLARTAVEECLRFDGVVQVEARRAVSDTMVDRRQVRAGEEVLVLLGAANRDVQMFPRPDALDVTRQPNPHLGFGRGEHACLGLHLARAEMMTMIRLLLLAPESARLADEPRRLAMPVLRGLRTLPIVIR
jgi:cytochrome P450